MKMQYIFKENLCLLEFAHISLAWDGGGESHSEDWGSLPLFRSGLGARSAFSEILLFSHIHGIY